MPRPRFRYYLCIGTGVLWVRSYKTASGLNREHEGFGHFNLWSRAGGLELDWARTDRMVGDSWKFDASYPAELVEPLGDEHKHAFLGFVEETFGSYRIGFIRLPYWFLALLLGIGPVTAGPRLLRQSRRDRRYRSNLCTLCGYDLRASKDRCPECGTPIPAKS